MTMTIKNIGILIALLAVQVLARQPCKKVYDTSVHCLEESENVTLTCPSNHKINIEEVHYYVSSVAECPIRHELGTCRLGALTSKFRRNCKSNECTVSVTKKADSSAKVICQGDVGAHYIGVKYQCIANYDVAVPSLSVCDNSSHTGSLLRVQSHETANRDYTANMRCQCRITAHSDVEIQFETISFAVDSAQKQKCSHQMTIDAEAGDALGICQGDSNQNNPYYTGCYQQNSSLTMKYSSTDNQSSAAFIIEAQVHPDELLTVECGIIEIISPIAANSEEGGEDLESDSITSDINPFVIAACLGAAVIMIIAIVIILTRKRTSQEIGSEESSETGSNYAFVKDIYLEDGMQTKQVVQMDKNKTLPGQLSGTGIKPPPAIVTMTKPVPLDNQTLSKPESVTGQSDTPHAVLWNSNI